MKLKELAGQLTTTAEQEKALDWLLRQTIFDTNSKEKIMVMKWVQGDESHLVRIPLSSIARWLALYLKEHTEEVITMNTGRKFKEVEA